MYAQYKNNSNDIAIGNGKMTALMDSFSYYLEPVCCSMSSSNSCFLTCGGGGGRQLGGIGRFIGDVG